MKAEYLKIITLLSILAIAKCYKPCSVIKFNDYSFDLSGLSDFTIQSDDKKFFTKISPCASITCDSNQTSQKSFMYKSSQLCMPYTINATIFQNFNYIDPQSPKNGIKISYLPYIIYQAGPNQTIETSYSGQFKIYCSNTVNVKESCTQTVENISSPITNQTTLKKIAYKIVCSKSITNGCPYITVNNFWKFLSDNSIWFAIILWIFSIFQLFMGYFVIRLTILLYGIQTGAVFGIIFSAQNYQNFYDQASNGIIIFIIVISFLMGVLFGFVLLTMPRIGYMNIGVWDAIIFSLLLQNSVLYLTGSMLAFYITLGVCSLIMCAISLLRFRKFIILSSPFISAFWIIRTLGFFLPHYPNEFASQKLFAINASTPWQFYLYLVSIIILSVLGSTFQFCWYKKKGRDYGNKGYYLEDDDNIREKFKKLLQFKEIKSFINAGKEEMQFLKNIVVQRQSSNSPSSIQKPTEIQMARIQKKDKKKDNPKEKTMIKQKDRQNSRQKMELKERSQINYNKRSNINQIQANYSKKLKKFDQSDSDSRQVKKPKPKQKKSSINVIKSNPISKFQINNSEHSDQSDEQQQQQIVHKKPKRGK